MVMLLEKIRIITHVALWLTNFVGVLKGLQQCIDSYHLYSYGYSLKC